MADNLTVTGDFIKAHRHAVFSEQIIGDHAVPDERMCLVAGQIKMVLIEGGHCKALFPET